MGTSSYATNSTTRSWLCPCGRGHPFSSESNGSARTPSDAHIAAECWDLAAAALGAPPVLVTLALYLGDLDVADLRALRALGRVNEERAGDANDWSPLHGERPLRSPNHLFPPDG